MKLLALDTATEACSTALLIDGIVHTEATEPGRGHAQRILPMIDALLATHSLRLEELDAIAVGHGPGGFTGVRLAVSVAQGLALGAGLPAVGISNLAAVAQLALDRNPAASHVLVCNDARMKEVYTALYVRSEAGLAGLIGAERVGSPDSVLLPSAVPGQCVVGAGRAFRAYPQIAARLGAGLFAVEDGLLPSAGEVARLAAASLRAGGGVAPERLQPVYLRNDVAIPAVTVLQ
jgi:tRNA threonylcarbamoyladenosine biosynthesis protein TsaB